MQSPCSVCREGVAVIPEEDFEKSPKRDDVKIYASQFLAGYLEADDKFLQDNDKKFRKIFPDGIIEKDVTVFWYIHFYLEKKFICLVYAGLSSLIGVPTQVCLRILANDKQSCLRLGRNLC